MAWAIGVIQIESEGEEYRLTPKGANRPFIPPTPWLCLPFGDKDLGFGR